MFCDLGEERTVQDLERKKGQKQEKTHRGQKWVGKDERVS